MRDGKAIPKAPSLKSERCKKRRHQHSHCLVLEGEGVEEEPVEVLRAIEGEEVPEEEWCGVGHPVGLLRGVRRLVCVVGLIGAGVAGGCQPEEAAAATTSLK